MLRAFRHPSAANFIAINLIATSLNNLRKHLLINIYIKF